jgi:hypothetical protein
MKRWLVGIAIFVGSFAVLFLSMALIAYRAVWDGRATGIGLVFPRDVRITTVVVTILPVAFAVWLSGKLIR